MKGYSFGRPRKHKTYLEDCLILAAGLLRGKFVPSTSLSCEWIRGDKLAGNILIKVEANSLWLHYQTTGKIPRQIDERVLVVQELRHFGGEQLYLHCPRCSARSSKLYMYRNHFTCRKCTGLTYRSKSMSSYDRLYKTYNRYMEKLDPLATNLSVGDMPEKPKGMHWSTYKRITDKARKAESKLWETLKLPEDKLGTF